MERDFTLLHASRDGFGACTKAECRACDTRRTTNARDWAHQHVRETGHTIELYIRYDVRPEDWMDRLTTERLSEIEELRGDPDKAHGLAEHLLQKIKGQRPN